MELKNLRHVGRSLFIAAVAVLATFVFCGAALASPASLDPSFDADGRATTDFAPVNDLKDEGARDVVVQPDGKIVAVGEAQGANQMDVALARYNPDGSLDASFGTGGRTTADISGANDWVSAAAIQPDGKVVVVGYAPNGAAYEDFFVARFDADGSLDESFGINGKRLTDFPDSRGYSDDNYANDVAVQADGSIVVAGSSNENFALARYNAAGSLDPTFDADGRALTDLGTYGESARAVALQPDGKIVAVGSTEYGEDFALVRYNPDGSLDPAFDGDGKLVNYISSGEDYARDVAIDPNGKIVVAGEVDYNAALVRYNFDGTFDASFGRTGKAINPDEDAYGDLAVLPDGGIIAKGSYYGWSLAKHNPNGTLDTSFGSRYNLWGGNAYPDAYAMALQEDGKVVLAGEIEDANGFTDFALSRHMGAYPDATKPTGTVAIDNGRRITKDTTVVLTLNAEDPAPNPSGVARMRLKNAGASWSKWLPYERTKTWRLSRAEGKKAVYVEYEDLMGNVSAPARDTIVYRR